MNLDIFMSPTIVTITIIMVCVLILQLWIDRLRLRQLPNIRLRHSGSLPAKQKVSIIVTLNRRAETLIDLLDHLRAHNYEQLEVVVVVKQTAGKNASNTLRRYRKLHTDMTLRIVKHKKGMDSRVVASRYARGEIIVQLEPSLRLSPGFFAQTSAHFNIASLDELIPAVYQKAGNSIVSGLDGWTVIFQNTRSLLIRKPTSNQIRLVRRTAFVNNKVAVSQSDSNMIVQVSELQKKPLALYRVLLVASAIAISWGAIAFSQSLVATKLIVSSAVIGYVLFLVLLLASYRGVSLSQKMNLAILIPLTPLLLVFSSVKRN